MNAQLLWTLLALGPLLGRITADLNGNRTPTTIRSRHQRPAGGSNGAKVGLLPDLRQQATANQPPAFVETALGFCEKYQLPCPADCQPLCAVNAKTNAHRTFHNECEMRRAACLAQVDWKLLTQGPCSQHPKNRIPKSRVIRNIYAPQVNQKIPLRDTVTDIMTPPIFHAQYLGVGGSPKAKLQPYFDKIFNAGAMQAEGNEDNFRHWNGAQNMAHGEITAPVLARSSINDDVDTNKGLNTGEYQGTFVIPSIDSDVPYESLRSLEQYDESRRRTNTGGAFGQTGPPKVQNEPQAKAHRPDKYSFLNSYRQQSQSAQGMIPNAGDSLKTWHNMQTGYQKTFLLDSIESDMNAPAKSFEISEPPVVHTYDADIYGLSKVLNKPLGILSRSTAENLSYHTPSQLPDVRSGSSDAEVASEQLHKKRERKVSSVVYLKDHEGRSSSYEKIGATESSKEALTVNRYNRQYLEDPRKSHEPIPRNNSTAQVNQELLTASESEEVHTTVLSAREPSNTTDDVPDCKLGSTPVCGSSSSGETKTFKNLCDLEHHIRLLKQSWTVLHEGACENCSDNCSGTFEPICVDRSGVSFTLANACYFELAKCRHKIYDWKMLSQGECQSSKRPIQYTLPSKSSVTSSTSSVTDVKSVHSENSFDKMLESVRPSTPKTIVTRKLQFKI